MTDYLIALNAEPVDAASILRADSLFRRMPGFWASALLVAAGEQLLLRWTLCGLTAPILALLTGTVSQTELSTFVRIVRPETGPFPFA